MKDQEYREKLGEGYSVRIIGDVEGFEGIRDTWEKAAWHYFSDIDFCLTIANARNDTVKPYIMVVSKDGVPETIIVGRIESQKMACKIGYKTVYAPEVRVLYIEYGGVLGNQSNPILEIIIAEILNSLKRGDADIACFSSLKVDSEVYRMLRSKPPVLSRDYMAVPASHWSTVLPPSFEAFMKTISSKHRYWLRRTENALRRDCQGEILVKLFRTDEEVEPFCRDAEKIAGRSYQRGLGVGFVYNEEMKKRLELSARLGWLRAYVLYFEKSPIAYWLTSHYKNKLYLDSTGYDPSFRKYEPGTILLVRLIELLYQDKVKVEEIDFGFGDASYKERFGNRQWQETFVYAFSPTFKGIKLNLMRSLILGVSVIAIRILGRMKLTQKLKTYWRNKMVQSD